MRSSRLTFSSPRARHFISEHSRQHRRKEVLSLERAIAFAWLFAAVRSEKVLIDSAELPKYLERRSAVSAVMLTRDEPILQYAALGRLRALAA